MDVRCERCSTEYEFDDALVSDKGTTVKCMSCGHQFRVQRPSALKAPDKWLVRRPGGEELVFVSLRELQKAIAAHQVGKEDHLFRGALRARALGSIPELQPFFDRAQRPTTKATSRGLGIPAPGAGPGAAPQAPPLPSMSMTQPFALAAPVASPTPTPAPPRPGSLPSLNEPIPPLPPASPATPMPPPRASSPPAPPRPVANTVKSAPPPPVAAVKSAPPPPVQAPIVRSAPPPAVTPAPAPTPAPLPPLKSTPPVAAVKSAPPPPVKTAPPPVVRAAEAPPPAAIEPLPPMSAPVPDEPRTEPVVAPPERSKPRPASSDPPARPTRDATSDRPATRTRSVPPDLDANLPVRRDPGITRWIVAGSVLGITALLAGTLGRKYVVSLGPGGSPSPNGTALSAPPTPTAAQTAAATPPAAQELLTAAEKSVADGDLEGAKETLVRASALAPQDGKILLALAKVAVIKADVSWLRLRLLPKTATDARRVATTDLADAAKRAKAAADAAAAASPDAIDSLRWRADALRQSDDVSGARALTSRLTAGSPTPENALTLAALDLAGEEPPTAATLERLRLATTTDGGAGRARALLVFGLARAGDPENANKELEKLAALPRPYPLLPELRALVAATKPGPLVAAAGSAASPVDIGKLPTVVPAPVAKPEDTGYKINDAPTAKPDATATPPAKPDATVVAPPKPDPKPAGTKGKSEFSEEELHRKLFGDQPK